MPWQWPWTRHDRALWNVGDVPSSPTAAGQPVTPDRALRLSTVWGCVRLLADSVSTLPLAVYRDDERDPLPTPPLLRRPSADHPELSDWLWAIMACLLTRGNAWGMISDRSGAGLLPAQVDLLDPDRVGVTEGRDGPPVIRVDGQEVDRGELWHVKAYPAAGSILGMSPVAYAREAIGLGLAAERFGAQFFGDNATPSGVLTSDQRINAEQAERLKVRWKARHAGRREIAVLGDGAKFQAITIAPEEAQFIETQRFSVSTICRFYGVPPEMVGGETAGHMAYSSPEMRSTDLLTFTVRPWLLRIERAISTLLPRAQAAKFNAGGFVRATLLDRYTAHKLGIEAGFLTVNEARELEDRPPLPPAEGGAVA
jgi:HK97 family phage portal protein